MHLETLRWVGALPGHVEMIEQTLLPERSVTLAVESVDQMRDAIYRLAVRGAPAIGVAAAYGVVLGVQDLADTSRENVVGCAREAAATLAKARPTAVNLFWALARMKARADRDFARGLDGPAIVAGLLAEAQAIHAHDRETCRLLGDVGAELLHDGATVLTHCNAGSLATGGMGTALAPIYRAHAAGKRVRVFADETRPLLQGARLTAHELQHAGIDVTLITDSMAGRVMFERKIDLVLVGADRIARNGDACNKIGTYSVAVLAKEHAIPFYVVAPLSTFDPELDDGSKIPIEERPAAEITHGFGRRTAPEGVKVYNPAFDVTPARLITGIVTEVGLIERPNLARVEAALARGAARTAAKPASRP
ncbi:MAG: S-methyl-5-thioribose-1-phosphate isomerase [Planctomycetes bacterium]|nr:S-methyl-5-thioribose-1-phosphate isomerase [Planctomycetota bacterium]